MRGCEGLPWELDPCGCRKCLVRGHADTRLLPHDLPRLTKASLPGRGGPQETEPHLPWDTWVTRDRVGVCTAVRLVVTTAEAVTEVTALTPCVGARDTRSEVAGEPTARGWVWTTWAGAEPPEVWKGKARTCR